jgi:2,3-diketo-5-methylthio-1-phosphopentane phosphatase
MSGEKQSIKVVLLDIEGTTTSISFVSDVLFPYARRELSSFLDRNFDSSETQADIEELRKLAKADLASGNQEIVQIPEAGGDKSVILEAAIKNVLAQMNTDRKTTALKQLQGHIWRHGFESGELQGDVYDDVMDAFKKWKGSVPIFIYSSGSIAAQKLLFGYNKFGNLSEYLVDHFDTTIGSKLEAESYNKIFDAIVKSNVVPNLTKKEVLFGTDNIKEAIAADEAGLSTIVSIRPDTLPLPADHKFHTSNSFADFWKYYQF